MVLAPSLLSGCLSRPSLVKQSFAFTIPATTGAPAAKNGRILGIHQMGVAPTFDTQSLVYRTGEFSYERDPYAEFLVPPAESLQEPIRGYFRQSGAFSAVAEPGSVLKPNTLVEVYVSQLYGDFRNRADPEAVLAIRLIFFEAPSGQPVKVLSQKEYSRRVRLKARTAAALMAGWNQELGQIIKEAATDFAHRNPASAGQIATQPVAR